MQKKKWTRKTCSLAASECSTRGEFAKRFSRGYRVSLDNGWIGEYGWLVDGNEERTKKLRLKAIRKCLRSARKCSSVAEFRKEFKGDYDLSTRNDWIGGFQWLSRPRRLWTKENCEKEARKYSSRVAFRKGSYQAYAKACKMRWLGDYSWIPSPRKPRGWWTKEHCLEEAMNYRTMIGFRRGCVSAFLTAFRNGWLKDIGWFEKSKIGRPKKNV